MAPSPKEIEQALLDATYEVYSTAPDDTTVNKVRGHVEEKLGLEDGFFSAGDWKSKSKVVIKGRVDQLLDGWVPETKDDSDSNVGTKRRSSEAASSKPKRQKRDPKPKPKPVPKKPAKRPAKKPAKKVESDLSELSELDDLSEEEKPQPKKTTKSKKLTKKSESDLSELSELSDLSEEEKPRRKTKAKASAARKSKAADSDEEDDAAQSDKASPGPDTKNEEEDDLEENKTKDGEDNADETAVKQQEAPDNKQNPRIELGDAIKDDVTEDSQPAVVEEDEYSDVIDEPAKPKRKKGEKKEKKEKSKKESSSKKAKPSKAASKKASVSEDPQEAEIKKLQSYLIKCGIRKLWHNELKEYGDDSRAKIRHLRKMLSDAGMDGRFSEAKAREIKETRELMAEAEAAQEMNRLWGMGGRGRAMRSKAKVTKDEESEASEGETKGRKDTGEDGDGGDGADDDDDDEKEPVTFAARRRRAQAELAFLGDDSDSD